MSLTGNTNDEKIWNYLKAQGLTDCGAAGLMGNLDPESGLIPTNLQNTFEKKLGFTDASYTAAVDAGTYTNFANDRAGYGLAQWTYPTRKAALLNFVKSMGRSIGDLEAQLGFLITEMAGSFGEVLTVLRSAASVKEASDCVLLKFEKPASVNDPVKLAAVKAKRAEYGQKYYDKFAGAKGGTKLNLVQSILTKNPCYTSGRKITVKGLMLHSVGCPQPSAQVFVRNWNKASYGRACVHGFIDANDGTVYQTLPWNHRGWHCGGSGNNTHIGVEMCEPACIKYTSGANFTCSDKAAAQACAKRTYDAAVQLFAMLCKEYKLDPLGDGVIVSHKEGCKRGIASNHGDPEHLWTQLGMSYTMDGFRKDVKAAMAGTVTAAPAPAPAKPATGFKPYTVRISIDDLRIRSGAGTNYASKGYIKPGVYTIVEEADGKGATKWGKLKSGAGWVSLDYCKKV